VKGAVGLGAAVLSLLLLPAAAGAQTLINFFAGDWSTFGGSGTLSLQVTDAAHGQPAVAFYSDGMASCPVGTTYYTGAYPPALIPDRSPGARTRRGRTWRGGT
jgi:hypothetical protein